jgi:hypothetical protein
MVNKNQILIIGAIFFLLIVLVVFSLAKQPKPISVGDSSSINNNQIYSKGKFQDKTCQVSFEYPPAWVKSEVVPSFSREPLVVAVFNEPAKIGASAKNSIFTYLCYSADEYTFEQLIPLTPFEQNKIESLTIAGQKWQRVGNFVYTVKNSKLIIFQMFFTKFDLKPEPGYEEILLKIMESVE